MIIREATPTDAPAIARVHVDTWRTTYPGMVPDEHLENLSYEESEQRWDRRLSGENRTRDGFCYVAEDDAGQVVGFALGGPERTGDPKYKGEVYAIYILEPYQGKGLGRRLMSACIESLVQANFNTMLIWVIEANPACRFYEALGDQRVHERQEEVAETTINEVAYGWTDITALSK